jgi:prolyl oligopeptidase
MRRSPALALILLAACGGAEVAPVEPAMSAPVAPEPPSPADELEALAERARSGAVTETIHGLEIDDPYRALETDSELTRAWVDAQSRRTAEALAPHATEAMRARLDALLSIGSLAEPALAGGRLFYTRREGEEEQPSLVVTTDGGAPRVLVDPARFGERAALDYFFPSPDGSLLAFGISESGDERSTLLVLDVDTGALRPDRLEHAKWASVAFLHDGSGFYYTRYPAPGEPGYDEAHPDTYFPRVFFHRLGDDPGADVKVFEREDGSDVVQVSLSDDDRYLVLNAFRSWSASDVYLFDRGARAQARAIAPADRGAVVAVREGQDFLSVAQAHRGRLYLLTDEGAPRSKILAARLDLRRPLRFSVVVPEGDGPIEGWALSGDALLVHTIEDVASRLHLVSLRTRASREVALPADGEVDALAADEAGGRFALTFSAYVHPPALFRLRASDPELREVARVGADFDFASLTTERVRVTSADGTEVPLTLIARGPIERDGARPVILYGYGGFDVSLLPGFQRNLLYWLERGGVYAVANLRGGGEFGEAWHRAGMLEDKHHVFEDFEAAIRWLTTSGISRPERIGITGGSNGGLLVGAILARAPEIFGAAASYVGLYDMVRYHLFPPAELWVPEYGSAEDPAQLPYLASYSPYHRARRRAYPPTLIETADHDTRVHFGHSAKFAARLQELQQGDAPIYFFMERAIGHGAGTRRSDLVARYVRMYAFFEAALGVGGEASPTLAGAGGRE